MLLPALIALTLVVPPSGSTREDPGDWPQWRGAAADGLSHGVGWSAEGKTLWTAEIGLGYSAPSVAGARVVTLGFDTAREQDVLRALELASGATAWSREWPGELRANQHEGGTLSTPSLAEGAVFVSTAAGTVRCHRLEDGQELWVRDVAAELGLEPTYYGYASSPLVRDGRVYVNLDRAVALDARTGELLWKSEPLSALYATPAPFELAGQPTVAVFGQTGLSLLERASGAARAFFPWHKSDRLVNSASPVVAGERLFVSSAYEHGCALVEFPPEGARAVWENKLMRNKMAGCVLVDGALFGFDESVLKCLDLEGQERWRVRGLGSGALSGGDGKLAILSSSGELVVASSARDAFHELSRTPLFEGGVCWTPPTIAGGRLLLRNNRGTLVCRDHRGAAPAPAELAVRAEPLPEAAELVARHRAAIGTAEAWRNHPHVHRTGTYEQRSVGFVPAPFVVWQSAPDKRRVEIQFPPPLDQAFAKDGVPGRLVRVCDGEAVFELNPYRGDKLYAPGEEREERVAARLASADGALLQATLVTRARTRFDERECFEVEATADGRKRTLYFEVASGLLAGRVAEDEGLAIYRDYRAFDGLLLPTFERVFRPEGGIEETFRTEHVSFEEPPADAYARSEKVVELLAERKGD